MANPKVQTGLAITRKNNTFTFSWKLGDTYKEQMFVAYWCKGSKDIEWAGGGWPDGLMGGRVTSKNLTLNKSLFYPTTKKTIDNLYCELDYRSKQAASPSLPDPANSIEVKKTFAITIPALPSLTATPSDSLDNTCTFSWITNTTDTGSQVFTDVEWQSILVANSTEIDGSKLAWKTSAAGWQTGTGVASSNKTIAESNATIATGSHTRWFRVRSRGPAGASAWRYAKRVYAVPATPKITSTQTTKTASGYKVLVNWTSAANAAYPVEENILEYVVAIPGNNLSVPPGVSWTPAQTIRRVGSSNAGLVMYDSELDEDQVLFVRVRATHVLSENASSPVVAKVGMLATPEITDVSVNPSTYVATVQATNKSSVPDSFLVVIYRTASKPSNTMTVGVIPSGQSSATIQLPNFSQERGYQIGVYAAVGTYSAVTRADGVSSYTINAKMTSIKVWEAGLVPKAPTQVTVTQTDEENVRITWDWPWDEATSAIIAWSDHEDAWQSTSEPQSYEVTDINANTWFINGIETGKTWYFRVRLKDDSGDVVVFSPWSDTISLDLTAAPLVPVLTLSNSIIAEDGAVTGYWAYTTGDGTGQAYAEICEATISGSGITYGEVIGQTKTAQHITIYASDAGWNVGETHYLAVRVMSASGHMSDEWSAPVPVMIANPIYATLTASSLTEESGSYYLEELPITATIEGAGAGGTTTLIIERADDYAIDRPNGIQRQGFQGETIVIFSQLGETEITINQDMLIGLLDDGASYNLIGIVQDGLGQSDQMIIPFEVRWSNQAVMPEGDAYIYEGVGVVAPVAPQGASAGATCDIYRLSADLPELIVQGASFGERYVDPYPSINEGGYRIVYISEEGDYITAENMLAWIDIPCFLEQNEGIIDFNGEQIPLFYDASQENDWEKDFKETKYLGGSIQGDWSAGVRRKTSFDVSYVTWNDESQIQTMKRLAEYTGICHLRTRDGSSFDCDIQVSESRDYGSDYVRAEFSLSITKVDTETLAGVLYDAYFNEE